MEKRAGKSGGAEISRKTKSLDIQSLYKSSVLRKEGNSKRKSGVVVAVADDGGVRKKKRKSRKEVLLSSFEQAGRKGTNSLDEVYGCGVSSDSFSTDTLQLGLSGTLDNSSGFNSISLNLDDSCNVIRIPKRRRDFVGRKKFESKQVSKSLGLSYIRSGSSVDQISKLNSESNKLEGNQVLKTLGLPGGKTNSVDQVAKLNGDSACKVVSRKVKGKSGFDDLNENRTRRVRTARLAKEEDGKLVSNNGDASSGKRYRNNGKRKDLDSGSESFDKIDTLSDSSIKLCYDSCEENGENLEQNSVRIVPRKVKGKSGSDNLKKNRTNTVSSSRTAEEEDGQLIVNNGNASSGKSRSNNRKRKGLTPGSESFSKIETPADSSIKICDDSQDEDDDNLEQNAARMLSSRFDPNFAVFSSKSRSSGSPSTSGLPFYIPCDEDFHGLGINSLVGLESSSLDAASRALRPRKQCKEKGLSRKRRHFYEILCTDLDANWLLNKKIKVFWPLDESWYYGLVNDYDPKKKLHHIKYDDRDEEWINLQNERFKLLLLPGEVPCKTKPKSATAGNKHDERDLSTENVNSFIATYIDSEPIISWLVRSSGRVKSSSLGASKRHKTSQSSPNFAPFALSTKTDDAHGCFDIESSKREMNKPYFYSALPNRFTGASRGVMSDFEGSSSSKDGQLPVVYSRRRLQKKDEGLFNSTEDNNAFGTAPASVTFLATVVNGFHASRECDISRGHMESEGLLWSVDSSGLLKLTIPLVESKQFRFELCSPVPVRWCTFGSENIWLLRIVFLLHYGTVMTTWPKVHLEMLFIDNVVGLRFLLFEGCLKQAVAFVFLILTVFYEPSEQGNFIDVQMPVTSIRFKVSCVEDGRKQHVFAFYSFSKVKCSKWLYLDCKLQRHCLHTKKLPLSECTYDNIKAMEGGNNQLSISSSGSESSTFEGFWKKSMQGIMPRGAFRESCSVAMNQSSTNSDVKHRKRFPFALSFAAAPALFLGLHLRLLMENSVASISLQDHNSMYSLEDFVNTGLPVADGCTLIRDCSESVSEIPPESNPGTSLKGDDSSRWLPCAKSQLGAVSILKCDDGGCVRSSQNFQNDRLKFAGNSAHSRDPAENTRDVIVQTQMLECSSPESEQFVTFSQPLVPKDRVSVCASDAKCYSGLSVEIPLLDHVERSVGKTFSASHSADRGWNMSKSIVRTPNRTGPRSMWHRNRTSSSSSFGDKSCVWHDGKTDFIGNGFGNGPKKPRTQVQYTLPFGGFDISSKHKIHNQRRLPYQRIRKPNDKRISDSSTNSYRNLELLACDANLLITIGDRGWRECGSRVVLEHDDHNEWRLAVKLSGTTKYSYKAHQFLQPGSTNRYTHAMMWKGGKDWVLEFPDRSQWMHFKEMHEECYNRNIRVASVKNIPIPGVCLIEESDDSGTEMSFVRSSPKYFRQVEYDVDMALDPSRILYDMDSDDEQWILKNQNSSLGHGNKCEEICDKLFEKTMDMFEKVAYTQQCDRFTSDEIEEFMVGVGPMEAIKIIHEHWRLKRQRKGMPLIRHLQPPLWERYEQQVKEWEQATAKANCAEKATVPPMEKPPMFAFCLKPRGLEVLNKGSKQRSQRKYPGSGPFYSVLGDQDGLHAIGRRSNGFGFGDEKVMFQGSSCESPDASTLFHASTRVFSPWDANGSGHCSLSSEWTDWHHHPRLHRNKSKKIGTFLYSNNAQMVASYNQRTMDKRNGVHWWNMGLPEWPSQKHYLPEVSLRCDNEQLDGTDEFRLRDASGAAQHALDMAKLKRERAERLLYRADLAMHKAVVALMTADAIKASFEDSDGYG